MDLVSQNLLLASAGKKDSTFVDDVFSTYLYKGTNGANTVNTGLDMSGEGGLLWIRARSNRNHQLFDTVRGVNKVLSTSTTDGEITVSGFNQTFTTTGFTLNNSYTDLNDSNVEYASWNFRKAKGFFDVVSYSGSGTSSRDIAHSLGCIPGMITIKRIDSNGGGMWTYHRDLDDTANPAWSKVIRLDSSTAQQDAYCLGADNTHTSSTFRVGNDNSMNASGGSYIAYLWAGGASTAATAKSVAFSSTGANDGAKSLTIAASSDTDFGSGDFTMECWFKDTRTNADIAGLDTIFSTSNYTTSSSNNAFSIYYGHGGFMMFNRTGSSFSTLFNSQTSVSDRGHWQHFAWTRSGSGSNNNQIWLDGKLHVQFTNTLSYTSSNFYIGGNDYSGTGTPDEYGFNGKISNVRLIKGQAIYTTPFKPTNEPFTTTSQGATASNVKVICCNNSSVTGSTVTSGTITATNAPTASTDVPFDDPEGFKFGEEGDQNIIKTGSYIGNGNANGPKIFLGWEPQWLVFKNIDNGNENWKLFDFMRGMVVDGDDPYFTVNRAFNEQSNVNLNPTSTGFNIKSTDASMNQGDSTLVYIAIRRPDGYVGKPAEAGTDVYTQVYGTSNSDVPAYVSGFITDFAFNRSPTATENWWTQSRLTGDKYLIANSTAAQASSSPNKWDYMNGWYSATNDQSAYVSWMWKRHAGFDVVNYDGQDGVLTMPHSLSKTPEMIWVKARTGNAAQNQAWKVYHKGLNGGTTPQGYFLNLNNSNAAGNNPNTWNNTAPTSTYFTLGSGDAEVNYDNYTYIAILFASVEGISKVGYYTGDGSNESVTTGFQPRFIIIRRVDYAEDWFVFDSLRGLVSGSADPYLRINQTAAQSTTASFFNISSTGFTVTANFTNNNVPYIYYAHA